MGTGGQIYKNSKNVAKASSKGAGSGKSFGQWFKGYVTSNKGSIKFPWQWGKKKNVSKTLYRGDRNSPDIVFKEGIIPKGTHNDVLRHAADSTTPCNFISTSSRKGRARLYAGQNGYLYRIKTSNYIDVNGTYGKKSPFIRDYEHSVPGGVKADEIIGAYVIKNNKIVEYIKNANFGGF